MGKAARRRGFFWALSGFLFTVAAGTALHFLWKWTGQNRVAAAFSAVNESTWEHMKLLFFPAFLFSMIEVWFRDSSNFLAARGLSLWVGTALVPVLFYTYTGITGVRAPWADVAVLIFSVATAFLLDLCLRRTGRFTSGWQQAAGLAALWVLALVFVLWTLPPAPAASVLGCCGGSLRNPFVKLFGKHPLKRWRFRGLSLDRRLSTGV